jgi:twitching motility protein PilT
MAAMKRLFQVMADKKASDIFISVGSPINIKINGNAVPINQTVMTADTVRELLYQVLNERQVKEYEDEMELNTAYALEGVGAFRISAFRQKGSPSVVVRFIPNQIPPLDSLGLPEVLKEVIMQKRGLILMVGATGSGKSTSLSSMLDFRNERKSGHILTLEDPVEFIFTNKKSIVNQREIGTDTKSFASALKYALREDPDVILVGEMRDLETIAAALTIAETGHLALATLHTNSAAESINRIIDVFPSTQQSQVRAQLAFVLEGVVTQTLLPKARGRGRAMACEIMVATPAIRALIRDDKIHQIYSAMQSGKKHGMQTMNDALFQLYTNREVAQEECERVSSEPKEFLRMIGVTPMEEQEMLSTNGSQRAAANRR